MKKNDNARLSVGDWALVTYEGKRFPGEFVALCGEHIVVSVMYHARKGIWYWPLKHEVFTY